MHDIRDKVALMLIEVTIGVRKINLFETTLF